jgi:hypothetical protein
VPDKLLSAKGREFLAGLELPDAARERIEVSLAMIEALDEGVRASVCEAGATGVMCQSGSRSLKWILRPLRAAVQL